jgi:hypothetical protein
MFFLFSNKMLIQFTLSLLRIYSSFSILFDTILRLLFRLDRSLKKNSTQKSSIL